MWEGAMMVAASCVLYVGMGLHDAIVRVTGIDLRITGCYKCCTFWAVLAWSLASGYGIVPSVFAAFSLAYCALWAALALDALNTAYNKLYEQLNETDDTQTAEAEADDPAEADGSEVS